MVEELRNLKEIRKFEDIMRLTNKEIGVDIKAAGNTKVEEKMRLKEIRCGRDNEAEGEKQVEGSQGMWNRHRG